MKKTDPRRNPKTRIGADRAEVLKKSTVQAGKPKAGGSSRAANITRQMQNKGVKDGTIRIGRGGKSYNVYDAASGTWKKGVVRAEPKKRKPLPRTPQTPRKRNEKWGLAGPLMSYDRGYRGK